MKRELSFAFRQTIPVLCGYIFLGIAFGLLLQQAGFGVGWALLSSLIIYAGSIQFVLVSFLSGGTNLLTVAAMVFFINARHIFYGLSFLDRFKRMGKARPYMIFSLTDETYSLLCSVKVPETLNENRVLFFMSALDQCYWVLGSVIGSLAGAAIRFDTTGIDFAMTALFVVIFVEQWLSAKSRLPALLGLGSGIVCLLLLGPDRFILPALVVAVALLMLLRPILEKQTQEEVSVS